MAKLLLIYFQIFKFVAVWQRYYICTSTGIVYLYILSPLCVHKRFVDNMNKKVIRHNKENIVTIIYAYYTYI